MIHAEGESLSSRTLGYLLLSLAMMTVGSTVVASKLIAGSMPPFLASALRFALALPVLVALIFLQRERWPKLTRSDWGLLLLQAGAGSVGYTTLLTTGLSHLPGVDAGVIIGTLPAVSALFSVMVLGEQIGLVQAFGAAAVILAILVLTFPIPPKSSSRA